MVQTFRPGLSSIMLQQNIFKNLKQNRRPLVFTNMGAAGCAEAAKIVQSWRSQS
jgi:hypothetical protein